MVPCTECSREYCVPPLPAPVVEELQEVVPEGDVPDLQPEFDPVPKVDPVPAVDTSTPAEPRASRRPSQSRQTQFNVIVTLIALIIVMVSVTVMVILRGNRDGEETASNDEQATTERDSGDDTGEPQRMRFSSADVADFPPVTSKAAQEFVGDFNVVGEVSGAALTLAGNPGNSDAPVSLKVTQSRGITEKLTMTWSSVDAKWNQLVEPKSRRLGQGFRLLKELKPALERLGAYTEDDLKGMGVFCSLETHRIVGNSVQVTHTCLNEAEFRHNVPVRERRYLARLRITYELDGDDLTVSWSAEGKDPELVRMYAAVINVDAINRRRLKADELTAYQDAWLAGPEVHLSRAVKQTADPDTVAFVR